MPEEQPGCTILPMSLATDIRSYQPFNQQEASDREVILRQLETDPHVFDRDSLAHMTCSIWTVDPTVTQTLTVFHNTYGSWSWIGGHADGERDLERVALRELEEETGVADARIVPCGPGNIFSLEVLTVDGHEKRGRYVSSPSRRPTTRCASSPTRTAACAGWTSTRRWPHRRNRGCATGSTASSSTSWPRSTSK